MFEFGGASWDRQAKLVADVAGDEFTSEIALDGATLVVAAQDPNLSVGSAYVYEFNGFDWVSQAMVDSGELGHFTNTNPPLTHYPSIALDDLDGDNDLDVFIPTPDAGNPSYVWFNDGNGVFSDSGQTLVLHDEAIQDVALADLDGDGDVDVFSSGKAASAVFLNDGSGTFAVGQVFGFSDRSWGVDLGDVDGDGDLDAFTANLREPNFVWLNNGNGVFTDSGQRLGDHASMRVEFGDFDMDGAIDAFVANYGEPNRIWFNDGNGGFSDSGQLLGNYSSRDVAIGDLDGDADLDAIVVNDGEPNRVWLNDGTGAFAD